MHPGEVVRDTTGKVALSVEKDEAVPDKVLVSISENDVSVLSFYLDELEAIQHARATLSLLYP